MMGRARKKLRIVQRTIARLTRVREPETIKPPSGKDQPCSKGKPNRFECLKESETIHSVCRQDLPPPLMADVFTGAGHLGFKTSSSYFSHPFIYLAIPAG
jgi:hypothetical protein